VERRERKVAVAVVSYNTRELLLRCLESLSRDVDDGRAEVWVVDNQSTDGSIEAARAAAPWATVLDPGENLGYGRAVNLVAGRTGEDWLLAVNADVALEPGALEALLDAGSDAGVGCVAPRLILGDGSTEHSVHPFPTVPLTLAFNLGVHHLSRSVGDRLCLEGRWDARRARDVPWAIGACLLLRRTAFDQAGGFDEQQWMYAEDLDLQWRLRQGGWRTRYEPAARVRHESGAAASVAFGDQRAGRFMAASYSLLRRRRGAARMWITAAINIAGAALRVDRPWLRAHLAGIRGLDSRGEAR
jgi:N-acetylglucosaminyl-diphospho-decaprenol L-rhamnosyltransferase